MSPFEFQVRNARRLRWAFSLLLLLIAGCTDGSRQAREEFSRIDRAIDALRAAENHHKAHFIQPLRAAGCAQFCALRDQCVLAYETHVRALGWIDDARKGSKSAPRELDAAEKTLLKARELAAECAAAQAKISRDISR